MCAIEMHMTDVFCIAQILGTWSAVQCVSTDRLDKQSESSKSSSLPVMSVAERAGLIFSSSSERSCAGLIQGGEEIKEIRYVLIGEMCLATCEYRNSGAPLMWTPLGTKHLS